MEFKEQDLQIQNPKNSKLLKMIKNENSNMLLECEFSKFQIGKRSTLYDTK